MAACKGADELHHHSSLPPGFEDLLNDLVRSVISTQPLEPLDHIANYLEALIDRRTLWGMQLERGKQQHQKSNIVKSATDRMGTRETQPCPTPPNRMTNATRNLPSPKPPSPKPQNEFNEDCKSAAAKTKPRPATVLGKPVRSIVKRPPDVWADEIVLTSHLAQHEALRQVIKEIEDANEQIITLEETARNATQCAKKPRNTTQAKDLADRHLRLKRALDKMSLICTWIKSNELSGGRPPEVRETPAEKPAGREQHANTDQGTLENQIDTIKGTMQYIQTALADTSKRKTPNSLGEDNVLSRTQTMEQLLSDARGGHENTKILDDIAKLSQWLQHMFQMLSQSEAQSQATHLESQTTSSQNILMLTNTTEAKTADTSSPRKQKKLNVETSSSPTHSGTSSSAPGKQTKVSAAKPHQLTPANLTNEPGAEVDRKKATRINLQYYVNETDKQKDTRVFLVSTTSHESHTSHEVPKTKLASHIDSQISTKSGPIQDGTTIYQTAEAEIAQQKDESPLPESRRGSVPVPLRKTPKAIPTTQNASESELAKLQGTTKTDIPDKKDRKEVLTDDRLKSQTTYEDSNVSNIDSHSAFAHSVSSASEGSWNPNQATEAKPKEKHRTRKCETTNKADPKAIDNIFPQIPASSGSSQLSIHARTTTTTVQEFATSLSSEKIPHQPTNEQVLSNEVFSASFIKSSSYATASVQKGDTSMPTQEKPDNLPPNVSSKSLAQASSHSAAKSIPQKSSATKPGTDTTENLQPTVHSSASYVKSSSHATVKSSSPKDDPAKPTPETTTGNQQPNASLSPSLVKLSSHSTAKSDSKNAGTPSKEVIPATTKPEPSGVTSASFTKTATLSNQKGDVNTPASTAKPGQAVTALASPSKDTVQSPNQSTATMSSHKADKTTITKEDNPKSLQPTGASSPSFTKTSSHSTTKSGTQKTIPSSAKPLNDLQPSPRFVEYTNIFPQISKMQITPESSQSTLFKKQLSSSSARSMSNAPEASHEGGTQNIGVSSVERDKTQKDTKPGASLAQAEDPVETAFSKLLNKSSGDVTQKGSMGGAKQAEPKSKDSIKLEKASINSASKTSTTSNKNLPTDPESSMENKVNGKQNQSSAAEISETKLTVESIHKNTIIIKQDDGKLDQVPATVHKVHQNVSALSLNSFSMSEHSTQKTKDTGKT